MLKMVQLGYVTLHHQQPWKGKEVVAVVGEAVVVVVLIRAQT